MILRNTIIARMRAANAIVPRCLNKAHPRALRITPPLIGFPVFGWWSKYQRQVARMMTNYP